MPVALAPAGAARAAAARLERDVAAALAGHLGDPAGDDLGLPRGEGLRHGGLRDRRASGAPARPAAQRQHADHAHDRGPAAADGGAWAAWRWSAALFYGSYAIRGGHLTTGAFVVVPDRAVRDVHADQAAVARERHAAGGARGGRARLRGARPPRRGARGGGAPSCCRGCAPGSSTADVGFRYADGDGGVLRSVSFSAAPRRGGGDRRHQRRRQDDARQPAAALLRRERGRDPDRRRRRARRPRSRACARRSGS